MLQRRVCRIAVDVRCSMSRDMKTKKEDNYE